MHKSGWQNGRDAAAATPDLTRLSASALRVFLAGRQGKGGHPAGHASQRPKGGPPRREKCPGAMGGGWRRSLAAGGDEATATRGEEKGQPGATEKHPAGRWHRKAKNRRGREETKAASFGSLRNFRNRARHAIRPRNTLRPMVGKPAHRLAKPANTDIRTAPDAGNPLSIGKQA